MPALVLLQLWLSDSWSPPNQTTSSQASNDCWAANRFMKVVGDVVRCVVWKPKLCRGGTLPPQPDTHFSPLVFDVHRLPCAPQGVEFLGGEHCSFQNLITDRDGTINNYCGRYKSSIQSAYNSVFLSCFALFCCVNAAILTAAPLQVHHTLNPPCCWLVAF